MKKFRVRVKSLLTWFQALPTARAYEWNFSSRIVCAESHTKWTKTVIIESNWREHTHQCNRVYTDLTANTTHWRNGCELNGSNEWCDVSAQVHLSHKGLETAAPTQLCKSSSSMASVVHGIIYSHRKRCEAWTRWANAKHHMKKKTKSIKHTTNREKGHFINKSYHRTIHPESERVLHDDVDYDKRTNATHKNTHI